MMSVGMLCLSLGESGPCGSFVRMLWLSQKERQGSVRGKLMAEPERMLLLSKGGTLWINKGNVVAQ
jgi:hypothetical protein